MARLRYCTDEEPGIRRVRCGRGFKYQKANGRPATKKEIARIKALVIPPAWTDVWICADDCGHMQATGRDDRGRKQYLYHPDWRAEQEEAKYGRLGEVAEVLPTVRAKVDKSLARVGRASDLETIVAAVVRCLDSALLRVGNPQYVAANGSFGATTLKDKHAEVDPSGTVTFKFRGKGNRFHEIEVTDRRLARAVRQCQDNPGQCLFTYEDDNGDWKPVRSDDVNAWLAEVSGIELTAKDFRTWGGTVVAAESLLERDPELADEKAVVAAVDAAAERLGNTRAVCRRSYIHPEIVEAAFDGRLEKAYASSRSSEWFDRTERAVAKVLEGNSRKS